MFASPIFSSPQIVTPRLHTTPDRATYAHGPRSKRPRARQKARDVVVEWDHWTVDLAHVDRRALACKCKCSCRNPPRPRCARLFDFAGPSVSPCGQLPPVAFSSRAAVSDELPPRSRQISRQISVERVGCSSSCRVHIRVGQGRSSRR